MNALTNMDLYELMPRDEDLDFAPSRVRTRVRAARPKKEPAPKPRPTVEATFRPTWVGTRLPSPPKKKATPAPKVPAGMVDERDLRMRARVCCNILRHDMLNGLLAAAGAAGGSDYFEPAVADAYVAYRRAVR